LREREFHQTLEWSNEARKLLDNPLLQRFFSETEKNLLDQWLATKPDQLEEREVAYKFLTLNRKFKQYFENFLANEEYARQQLAEMEQE
jgi:hypothetical protein